MTAGPSESSEERYRAFIEQTAEGVWRVDLRESIDIRLPPPEQIDRSFELASEDAGAMDLSQMVAGARKNPEADRST